MQNIIHTGSNDTTLNTELDDQEADEQFSKKMPRKMKNGDIALPYSTVFVMKRIEDFDPVKQTL